MNNHLFSIFILLSISTHLFAMDGTTLALFKEEGAMDWSEWLVEHKIPLAGSLVIGSGAWSLYKGDKRPFLLGCTAVGCCAAYIYLNQQDDERTQRINALKEKYGVINGKIGEITDDLTQIKSNVISMNERIEKSVRTIEQIEEDLSKSKKEMKQAAASSKRIALLFAASIAESKNINGTIELLKTEEDKFMKSISDAHEDIRDTDTANTDLILKTIIAKPFSLTAAGQ